MWLSRWIDREAPSLAKGSPDPLWWRLEWYALATAALVALATVRVFVFVGVCVSSARILHERMLRSVLRAKVRCVQQRDSFSRYPLA